MGLFGNKNGKKTIDVINEMLERKMEIAEQKGKSVKAYIFSHLGHGTVHNYELVVEEFGIEDNKLVLYNGNPETGFSIDERDITFFSDDFFESDNELFIKTTGEKLHLRFEII